MIDMEAERAAIRQHMEAVEAAENGRDEEAFLATMVDDVILQWPRQPEIVGKEAARAWFREAMADFVSSHETLLQIEVAASGDVAWQRGTYVTTYEGPEGRMEMEGKYLDVLRKVNGEWLSVVVATSGNG
jgi:ketosteroid isomerase-like protein